MDTLALATRYFDAWRSRDPDAVGELLAADARFADGGGERPAAALVAQARQLFERYPDVAVEVRGPSAAGGDGAVGRWTMRVGQRAVRGADFLTVADGRVACVERFADRDLLFGLDEKLETGTVVHVGSSRRSKPGAFGITWQAAPTEEKRGLMRGFTDRILHELPNTPGFIGGISAAIGDRSMTVTAWEDPNDPFELIRAKDATHRVAAAWFFGPDVCTAGWTGVWKPERLNSLWVRCISCRQLVSTGRANGRCDCGAQLPEPPAYW
jgi:ketosteroid isomerase-like protein